MRHLVRDVAKSAEQFFQRPPSGLEDVETRIVGSAPARRTQMTAHAAHDFAGSPDLPGSTRATSRIKPFAMSLATALAAAYPRSAVSALAPPASPPPSTGTTIRTSAS